MSAFFDDLHESLREAVDIRAGKRVASRSFAVAPADIKALRKRLDVSQETFALMIGVSCGTLRNWEQGRRRPDGPARALLRVAEKHPEAVIDALS